MKDLPRLIALVEGKLKEADAIVGEYSREDYSGYRDRRKKVDQSLIDFFTAAEGASFRSRPPHDHAVKMAGIRSTSTSGWTGALHNWKTAARKRLEDQSHG